MNNHRAGTPVDGPHQRVNPGTAAPRDDDLMTEQMARPALKLVDRAYVIRGAEVRPSGTVDEIRDVALAEEYV